MGVDDQLELGPLRSRAGFLDIPFLGAVWRKHPEAVLGNGSQIMQGMGQSIPSGSCKLMCRHGSAILVALLLLGPNIEKIR
jgi:hypothetical protein